MLKNRVGSGEQDSCPFGAAGEPGAQVQRMNHLFLILTALAYLLSFVLSVRFLGTGKKLTGRLGALVLGLGLVSQYFALLVRSRGGDTVPYHDLYWSISLIALLPAVAAVGVVLY